MSILNIPNQQDNVGDEENDSDCSMLISLL